MTKNCNVCGGTRSLQPTSPATAERINFLRKEIEWFEERAPLEGVLLVGYNNVIKQLEEEILQLYKYSCIC